MHMIFFLGNSFLPHLNSVVHNFAKIKERVYFILSLIHLENKPVFLNIEQEYMSTGNLTLFLRKLY